ncbi:MAG: hypothetical protein ABJA74_06390 [Lapillicoccus sp.]
MKRRPPRANGRRPAYLVLAVATGLLAVAGCTGPGAEQAGQVAESFERLAPDDAAQACDLLAGHTREAVEKSAKRDCAEALGDEDLPDPSSVTSVEVYGHDALVHLGDDTVFLARFAEGWKVTAAGCRPGSSADEPFDCDVSGG